jgi:hypothetical protein
MAEERDYKRRRMSYRGKKLKRTPTQVLHDIIENHMAEIADAGGIGCFSKQPSSAPLPSFNPDIHLPNENLPVQTTEELRKSCLPLPGFQHQSGDTRQDSRGRQDRGGYVRSGEEQNSEFVRASGIVRNSTRQATAASNSTFLVDHLCISCPALHWHLPLDTDFLTMLQLYLCSPREQNQRAWIPPVYSYLCSCTDCGHVFVDLQGWRVTTGFQLNRVMRSSDMTAIDLGMIPKAVLIHLISIMVVV